MAKNMLCPQCSGLLKADGACSICEFKPVSAREEIERDDKTRCAFNDHGHLCQHRGILSHGTNGEADFFCREHWDVVNHRKPLGIGNALPEHAKRPSESVIDYMQRIGKHSHVAKT